MKKKWIKRVLIIALSLVIIITASVVIFKRDFDKVVNEAARACNTYSIDAEYDDEKKEITAYQKVLVKNIYGNKTDSLYFHLYPRAFREGASVKPYTSLNQGKCFSNGESFGNLNISYLAVDGEEKNVIYAGEDENVVQVECKFNGKEKAVVEFKYKVILPNCNHRFGYADDNVNICNWYPVLAHFDGEDFDISPYYSTGDPFCFDVSNVVINFTFPKEYAFASSGNIISKATGEKTNIKIDAKAIRDCAIVLSKKFIETKVSLKNTNIYYYSYDGDEDNLYIVNLAKKAMEFFNSKFGEYPYRQISIVKSPFLYGGMEYSNLVVIADNIVEREDKARVIVHELAHQWWYGVVGNNQIKDAWVDESITEYSSFLFFENHPEFGISYGELLEDAKNTYELYVDVITSLGGSVNYKMTDAVDKYASEYEYSYMIYVKGVIMYDDLRAVIGDKKFYKSLQYYFKANRFKIANNEDIIKAFEKKSNKNVKNVFNKYLYDNIKIKK